MPISMIMEDIRKRDQENPKREKEWKEEMMRKGANKDKRKRPDNLIIQEIDADMTNPAFVMRTAEAKGHFLYTSLNEIDQFDAPKVSATSIFVSCASPLTLVINMDKHEWEPKVSPSE